MEGVLLYLCVAERLEYSPAVGAQEVVRHVGVEVQVVRVIQKVSAMNKKNQCCGSGTFSSGSAFTIL